MSTVKKKLEEADSEAIANAIIKGVQEKKGKEVILMDLRNVEHAVCDYFVICHGDSSTQVGAIADSIEHEVRTDLNEKPWHKEGFENSEWILLDYSSVVAHVFLNATREFYALEDLWADAEVKEIVDEAV